MRRAFVLAAVTGALLAAAACGSSNDTGSGSSPSAAPTTAASVDVKANTAAACAAVDTLYGSLDSTARADLAKAVAAASTGDTATAAKAWATVKPLLTAAAATIKAEADKAASPEAKQALSDLAAGYEKFAALTSPAQIESVTGELTTAEGKVKTVCTDAGVTLKNVE
jgi:hypothetical protein